MRVFFLSICNGDQNIYTQISFFTFPGDKDVFGTASSKQTRVVDTYIYCRIRTSFEKSEDALIFFHLDDDFIVEAV